MSAIKDSGYAIELKGKEYRLLFTLNALDEIQTRFGGYDKLNKVFDQNNPNWVKDTRWLLTLLINEGILEEDENAETMKEERVGRLIHVGNLEQIQQAIFASFAKGTAGDGEDEQETMEGQEEGEMLAVREG